MSIEPRIVRNAAFFPSVSAFGHWWEGREGRASWNINEDWYGCNPAMLIPLCQTGDTRNLDEARRLMQKLSHKMPTAKRVWRSGVSGSFACVPDVLAGTPNPMRRFVKTQSNSGPLKLFLNTTTSASISAKDVSRRGVTMLALALYMQAQRPTELYVVSDLDCAKRETDQRFSGSSACYCVVRVPLANISLSVAALALTQTAFARGLCYEAQTRLFQAGSGWSRLHYQGTTYSGARLDAPAIAATKLYLGMVDSDIYIPGAHAHHPMMSQPEKWLDWAIKEIESGSNLSTDKAA